MIINLVYDASANNAPASFKAALQQAATILDAAITDPITVTIEVGYGEYPQNQSPVTNGSAEGGPNNGALVPYSQVVGGLIANAPGDPNFTWLATAQGPSAYVVVWPAQLKAGQASGLISAADNGIDGFAGFATDIPANALVGVALHEFAHAMGRVPSGGAAPADIFDLFRFISPNHQLVSNQIPEVAAYFSIDGGVTRLANFDRQSDPSDFLNNDFLTVNDALDEFYTGSTDQFLTPLDLTQLDVLGFHTAIVTWASGQSGDFALASNWSPTTSAGSNNNVEILHSGTYTVSSSENETINILTMAAGTTLAIISGIFTIDNGTDFTPTSGTIEVGSGATLVLDGTFTNAGTIRVLGGTIDLSGTISGTGTDVIGAGGVLIVAAGGSVNSTVILSSGTEIISSGGSDLGAQISGGEQDVFGLASGAIVLAGAQVIESGGSATSTTVSNGGTLEVLSGGVANNTAVLSGGTEVVSAGGTDAGAHISGGTQDVFGTANGATIFTGSQVVESGGTASSAIVNSGSVSVTQYLVNGSFETGDYTGWVRTGYGDGIVTGERVVTSAVTYTPENGNYFVEEGPVGSDGYLSQTFSDTPGTLLTVTGWVIGNGIGTASNDFVDFIFDGTTYVAIDPVPNQPWTQYSFNVIATGTDTFTLAFRDDPSGDGLDNFSITGSTAGSASATTIYASGTEIVSAGGTNLGAQISGGEQDVSGLASGVTIFAGGSQVIESGGSATSTTVSNGGTLEVLSGGSAIAPHLLAGGTLVIGGTLSGYVVSSGVTLEVSGGTVSETTVMSGGVLELLDGAAQSGTTISSGGILEIGPGQTLSGYQVSGGITLEAALGGSVSNTKVLSGGTFAVLSGGIANGITVSSGGTQLVDAAGSASATTIYANGTEIVSAGGTDAGAHISGGTQDVFGTASGATIFTGSQVVEAGVTAISTIISGGTQLVDAAGSASATTIYAGGTEIVSAVHSAAATDLGAQISGGEQDVSGLANVATIFAGGLQVIEFGGWATRTTVSNGGTLEVLSGGFALNPTVLSGGTLDMLNGGIASDTRLLAGGTLVIGGTLSGYIVSSGVTLEVSGGTVSKTTVLSGGTLELLNGAKQSGTTISSGGTLEIGSGQTLSGYLVSRGITLEAMLGGSVSNTKVLSGGTLAVLSGGIANGITVSSGGAATIASGAVVSGASKISATGKGATLVVEGDIFTLSSGSVVLGSGAQMDLQLGQVSGAMTIASGATVNALSGESTLLAPSGKAITNSGLINVENGATLTLSGTIINFGTLEVSATTNTTALDLENAKISGGKLQTNGGNAVIETVSGTNVIQGGTIVSGSLVEVTSGTQLNLNGGSIGKGATVETASGGTVIVSGTVTNSGTLFASGANSTIAIIGVVNGGAAEVGDGVVDITKASGEAVSFQSGGTGGLKLDVASAYTGKVSGLGNGGNTSQYIDLANIAFNGNVHRSYSGNTTSGVLTVTSGATVVAKIAMVGNYTTSSFELGADSSGHVKITDPPNSASDTAGSSTVTSGGSNGASFIDNASTFSGTVAGFGPHDHTGLPGIGFGAHTTLGYSEDGGDAGGTLLHTGTHGAKLALLGHYMATSFVTAADGHGGTLINETPSMAHQTLLAHPHG